MTQKARAVVDIMEAGRRAGVSRRCIYNWIAKNKVEYVRSAGGGICIFVDSLYRTGNVAADGDIVMEQPTIEESHA